MNKKFKSILAVLMAVFVLTGCSQSKPKEPAENTDGKLKVVSSFSILSDIASEVGGDKVTVHNLVPTGTDPHEYEPLPEDNKAATDADVLLFNGLNLEGGDKGWFHKLMVTVKQPEDKIFEASVGVEPRFLGEGSADEEINPHAFLDPKVGIIMTKNVRDAFIKVDPENKATYEANADKYLAELDRIDKEYAEKIAEIPAEKRVFTASEHAFQYMTETYGLEHLYIWEIDTEELGTPEQIKTLIGELKEKQPAVVFVESNVETRPMEQVSKESGIPIYKEKIYSDELGKKGTPVDTYIKFLEHNIRLIHDGLMVN